MQLQSGFWTVILQSAATQPRNPQILNGVRLPCPPDLCLEVDGFVSMDGEVGAAMNGTSTVWLFSWRSLRVVERL
jgi:hypothetical protein